MDGADLRRFSEMLETKENNPLIDGNINAENLLTITKKNADLSNTAVVTKPDQIFEFDKSSGQKPSTLWLEKGDENKGWTHIKERHITVDQIDEQPRTSYFPVGQTINGRTLSGPMKNENEVRNLIENAVGSGSPSQGPQRNVAEYVYEPNPDATGVSEITVRVNAKGQITGAFPESGPDVGIWIRDEQDWLDNLQDT